MKKHHLKSIILNQNELLDHWRARSEHQERLHDQMERLLARCENANAALISETIDLKACIAEHENASAKAAEMDFEPDACLSCYDFMQLHKEFARYKREFDGNQQLTYSLICRVIAVLEAAGITSVDD